MSGDIVIRVGPTHTLEPHVLDDAHRLLIDAFDGEFARDDWDHCLGGIHALADESGALVGHAAVVQRRMIVGERALRVGYVEGVGVRADRRRRGIGAALMAEIEAVIERTHDFGALSASADAAAMYAARGWRLWEGALLALTPDGVTATPEEEGGVYVWTWPSAGLAASLDPTSEMICDWRDGDVW